MGRISLWMGVQWCSEGVRKAVHVKGRVIQRVESKAVKLFLQTVSSVRGLATRVANADASSDTAESASLAKSIVKLTHSDFFPLHSKCALMHTDARAIQIRH
jgi:hypothetical protein